jgi:aquaporin Z
MKIDRVRQVSAEFFGTFTLALSVGLSIVHPGAVPTPVIAGLTLLVLVYAIGPVSGCHLNPAVTVAFWGVKKLDATQAVQYIVAQFVGALAAMAVLVSVNGSMLSMQAGATPEVWFAEALGAFILVFGIAAVVYEKVPAAASGLTIGMALLVGVLAASAGSNGVINPAISVSLNSLSGAYLIAPLIGAFVAAQLYRWFADQR